MEKQSLIQFPAFNSLFDALKKRLEGSILKTKFKPKLRNPISGASFEKVQNKLLGLLKRPFIHDCFLSF
jgi:hypothetical protein